MATISALRALQVLDSRGNPTVRAEIILSDGARGVALTPSGASTGAREALELRDGDAGRFGGKGVTRAVANVNGEIARALVGMEATRQREVDAALIELDGTPDKSRLGANAILAVSLGALRAAAASRGVPLHSHLAGLVGRSETAELPVPMFNILNGGVHAAGSTDFQEFMVAPIGADTFAEALRAGSETYHALQRLLHDDGLTTTVGDEGGFGPPGLTTRRAISYILRAIKQAGYEAGKDVFLALDPAASEFYKDGRYELAREGRTLTPAEMVDEYQLLAREYPIYSIEDGMAEDDWDGWAALNEALGDRVQMVGDDLFVTQTQYLRRGIEVGAANAILIKLNQVGTVSETLDTVMEAQGAGFGTVVSHRSGETEDSSIADLAVGVAAGQIKAGAPARGERTAKYNRLLEIEARLGGRASYAGSRVLR